MNDPDEPEAVELFDGAVPSSGGDRTESVTGRARRKGVPEWLALAVGISVVLGVWFVISRPSEGTETIDLPSAGVDRGERSDTVQASDGGGAGLDGDTPVTSPSTPQTAAERRSGADPDPPVGQYDATSVPLGDLDTDGWRLLVGDGQTIVDVDLGSGIQTRHEGIGAPLALVDGRLLVIGGVRLAWSSPDDLEAPTEQILDVPDLQRMLTRGRPADRPVVVGDGPDAAVWWPNNNADPQTWTKIRLADGAALDSIALTDTVYGGPDVVATIGSGTFERVDGRWVAVGDFFASSASRQAIVGQQCTRPDDCNWLLQRRGETSSPPERLPIPLGGPFDLRLVTDADRVLLRQGGGVTDHATGRFVPVPGAAAESVTAVNRSHLLALADGTNIGLRSAVVTLVDLDGPPGRSVGRIAVEDLVPRWLVLLPPSTG